MIDRRCAFCGLDGGPVTHVWRYGAYCCAKHGEVLVPSGNMRAMTTAELAGLHADVNCRIHFDGAPHEPVSPAPVDERQHRICAYLTLLGSGVNVDEVVLMIAHPHSLMIPNRVSALAHACLIFGEYNATVKVRDPYILPMYVEAIESSNRGGKPTTGGT